MVSAIKAAIRDTPVKADHTCDQGQNLAPAVVKLGDPDGQEDQCTAQQPGTIAAIAGEEGEQGQRSAGHTLSQRQATKKAPVEFHGACWMERQPHETRRW